MHRPRMRFVAALLLLAAGCDADVGDLPSAEVIDSAGVRIVSNPVGPDRPLSFTVQVGPTLGGKETPEESFYRVRSVVVAADDRGYIHVLDPDAYQVQVFDSTGRHLRTLGRQGSGPGELQFPFALTVADDGRVWVADIGRRRLVRWGPGGELLEPDPLPESFAGGPIDWTPRGIAYSRTTLERNSVVLTAPPEPLLELATTDRGQTVNLDLASCGMRFSGFEPLFSARLVWTTSGDIVATASTSTYEIDLYENGRLVGSVRRDVGREPATAAIAEASLGDGMRVGTAGGERVCDPKEVVAQQGFAPYLPVIETLALAPDRTLWVRRWTIDDAPGPTDVFDPEGRYVGTLPPDAPFPVGFLPDGRILAAETDAYDVDRLIVASLELEPEPTRSTGG